MRRRYVAHFVLLLTSAGMILSVPSPAHPAFTIAQSQPSKSDRRKEAIRLAKLAESEKDYLKAIEYLKQSIAIAQEINNLYLVAKGSRSIASIYFGLGNFKKAINYT